MFETISFRFRFFHMKENSIVEANLRLTVEKETKMTVHIKVIHCANFVKHVLLIVTSYFDILDEIISFVTSVMLMENKFTTIVTTKAYESILNKNIICAKKEIV